MGSHSVTVDHHHHQPVSPWKPGYGQADHGSDLKGINTPVKYSRCLGVHDTVTVGNSTEMWAVWSGCELAIPRATPVLMGRRWVHNRLSGLGQAEEA